jgi:uncharacterized protein YecE (DUF72 family)
LGAPEKTRIGCSGWSYKDWAGVFYPKNIQAREYLGFYSRFFDSVEIDSSFYRIPSTFMVEQWKRNTPEGFVFSPKLPKKITHEKKLQDIESNLKYFYGVMSKLGPKLGPIVAQLPPSIKCDKHRVEMENFLSMMDTKYRHAIEFRHKSWFTPQTYSLLQKHNVSMVWSLNQYLETPAEVTTDFVYLRMVGERDITEFSGIQKDRTPEMKRWAENLEDKRGSYQNAFIFFNNHFAGFGPESVNEFRRLLGMMEIDWKHAPEALEKQGSLTDF